MSRGPTDTFDVYAEFQRLTKENQQLKEQLAELADENHELSEQADRYLNRIAELEAESAAHTDNDHLIEEETDIERARRLDDEEDARYEGLESKKPVR